MKCSENSSLPREGGGGICLPCHTHNKLVLFVVSIVARKVLSVPVLLVLK